MIACAERGIVGESPMALEGAESSKDMFITFNPLNAELNPICHLVALLGGATIVVVSRLRVKIPFL